MIVIVIVVPKEWSIVPNPYLKVTTIEGERGLFLLVVVAHRGTQCQIVLGSVEEGRFFLSGIELALFDG